MTIFSPRASRWPTTRAISRSASTGRTPATTVARVVELFPETFIGVCHFPQHAGEPLDAALAELRRCVDMGFVGLNLNPDPSGGRWSSPPLTDRYWYPMYEAMVESAMCPRDGPRLWPAVPRLSMPPARPTVEGVRR